MSNHSYAYAMGRVRAVERKMLSQNQYDRMIESRTAEDALHILRENGYGGAGGPGGPDAQIEARGYESLLDYENEDLAAFITDISPEPRLLKVFLLRYDYHNIKVLLKAEFLGGSGEPGKPGASDASGASGASGGSSAPNTSGEHVLSRSGIIAPERLARIINERTLYSLPAPMAEGIQEAIRAYRQSIAIQSPDPQSIDIKLDQAMYGHMLSEAAELGNPFVTKLIKIYIDLANIGAFLRMRNMRKDASFLRGALIEGGDVDHGVYARYLLDSPESFVNAMQHTPYSQLCEDGVKSFEATGTLTVFERSADNYVNSFAKKTKLYPIGLELIAAYFVARQTELKNIRIIMVGKINGIAQDIIRERLRESYV